MVIILPTPLVLGGVQDCTVLFFFFNNVHQLLPTIYYIQYTTKNTQQSTTLNKYFLFIFGIQVVPLGVEAILALLFCSCLYEGTI